MKRFYYLFFTLCMTSFMVAQYSIDDVTINGQAFKRITGSIDANETLDNNNLWIIADTVRVESNAKLTITAGTQIFAEPLAYLEIERDEDVDADGNTIGITGFGEVDWQGTATNPIVFTSLPNAPGQGAGDTTPGQWGGIAIEGGGGGTNSGIVRYVRIEYAGAGSDGNNTFELEGVGSGTIIEYVQLFRHENRGFRLDGGDVNLRYVIATGSFGGNGNGFRFDNDFDGGWTGNGQFWVVNREQDATAAIESRDGSAPTISNVTITGSGLNDPGSTPSGDGIRVRNDGDAQFYNTVVTGVDRSVRIDNSGGISDGTSLFANSASFDNAPDQDAGTGFHGSADIFNPTNSSYDASFNNSVTPFTIVDSYVGTSTANSTPAGPLNPFFIDVNFVGAVQAGEGNDWTEGWVRNLDGTLREGNFSNDDFQTVEIKVFPNPVSDNLFINADAEINQIALYNSLGRKVYEAKGVNEINMSQFQNGLYFLQISIGNATQTHKLIKQ